MNIFCNLHAFKYVNRLLKGSSFAIKTLHICLLILYIFIQFKRFSFNSISPILSHAFPPRKASKYSLRPMRWEEYHHDFDFSASSFRGALGYFSTHTQGENTYIIPKEYSLNFPWSYLPPDHTRYQITLVLIHIIEYVND